VSAAKAAVFCLLLASLPSCLRPPAKVSPTVTNLAPAAAPASTPQRSVPGLPAALSWTSSQPIIVPTSDAKHDLVAVKDPTIVRFNDRWHVYAS
jgi:hypothetical protein